MDSGTIFAFSLLAQVYNTTPEAIEKQLEPIKPKPPAPVITPRVLVLKQNGMEVKSGEFVTANEAFGLRCILYGPPGARIATKGYSHGSTNEHTPSLRGKAWSFDANGEFEYRGVFFWFTQPGVGVEEQAVEYYYTTDDATFTKFAYFAVQMGEIVVKR